MLRILGLFDKYFLILMVIESAIAIFIDPIKFNKVGMMTTAKKSKFIGRSLLCVSVILYLITEFFV